MRVVGLDGISVIRRFIGRNIRDETQVRLLQDLKRIERQQLKNIPIELFVFILENLPFGRFALRMKARAQRYENQVNGAAVC